MTYSSEVLADTPALYLRHGEPSGTTMSDSSGNARNGTYTGVTLAQTGLLTADADTAVSITTSTANGQVAYGSWMNSVSITVEAWIKIASTGVARIIACRDIQTGTRSWQMQVNTTGKVVLTGLGAGLPSGTSVTSVDNNVVHHVVCTYYDPPSGNSIVQIWIDGVLDKTQDVGTDALPQPTSTPITIGNSNRTTTAVLDGVIDEVAFYTSVLTGARINAHYVAGKNLTAVTVTRSTTWNIRGAITKRVGSIAYRAMVMADVPLTYYRLDEASGTPNPTDYSGNGNTGNYVNGPTSVAGVVGTAMQVSAASSEEIRVGGVNSLVTEVSLELWWKSGGTAGAVIWRDTTTSNGWLMLLANSDADLTVRANASNRTIAGLGTIVDDGNWHHIVMTSSGTEVNTYVDGVIRDTWAVTAASTTMIDPLRLGKNGSGSGYYDGTYDEVALYSTVLSAARVAAHYSGGTPTVDAGWRVLQAVSLTRSTTWNVASPTASVTITRATTWKIEQRITVLRATTWNVASVSVPVTITRTTTWNVGLDTSTPLDAPPVAVTFGVVYNLVTTGLVIQPDMRVASPSIHINVAYEFARTVPAIPVYRAVVTNTSGKHFAELGDAHLEPFNWSVADMTNFGFTLPADSPNAVWMQEVRYEVQVWRNADLLWWGPIIRVQNEGRTIRVQCNDVSWYFAARLMGPVPKVNLLESAKPGEPAGVGGWKPKALPRSESTTGPSIASSPNTYNDRPALKLSSSTGKEDITYENDEWYDGQKFTGKGKNQLRALMDTLTGFSARPRIHVKVFDDDVMNRDDNIDRARARAEAVSDWVLDQFPQARVNIGAPGYRYPLNDNSTAGEREANRRTKVIYRSVDGVKGHKQCVYQDIVVRNPQPYHRKEAVTFSAYVFIEEEVGWAAQMRGLSITRSSMNVPHPYDKWAEQGYTKVLQEEVVPFGDGFPSDVWVRVECTVVLPNNGKKSRIEVRIFPPNGDACFSEMWLTRETGLYFRNYDQANIIRQLVRHAQDPAMGKSDLNISTHIVKTGKRRHREYPFADRATISDHLEEFPKLAGGMEWQIIYTPDDRIFTTYYPRMGKDTNVVLASGSNLAAYDVSSDGSAISTTVVIQAPTGEGPSREERVASDPTLMDGLILEKAYTGTPNSPASSWRAQAERGLARYRRPVVVPSVTIDPAFTEELLQSVHIGDRVTTDISDVVRNIDVFEKSRVTGISLDPTTDTLTYTLTAEDINVVNLSPFGTTVRYFSQAQNPIVGASGTVPVESNTSYAARTFNDSSWAQGEPGVGWVKEASFAGLQVNPEATPRTLVPDTHEVWIRKHVRCTGDMVLTVRAADWVWVYLNGNLVTGDYMDGYNKHGRLHYANLRIPSTWLDPSGDQVVAVHAQFKPFVRSSVEMDSLFADVAVRGTYEAGVVT